MLSALCGFVDGDDFAVACRVFLDDDAVGTVGQGRAGEDAHRFAASEHTVERSAGRHGADDAELCRYVRNVVGAHGISVHRRKIGGRLRSPRNRFLGENAARRLRQRNHFGLRRRKRRQNPRPRFLDRKKGLLRHRLLCLVVAGLAARLGGEADVADGHGLSTAFAMS